MKKLVFYIVCVMIAFASNGQMSINSPGLRKISDMSKDVGVGLGSTNNFSRNVDWPTATTEQALVRIQFVGVDGADIQNMIIDASAQAPIRSMLKKIDGINEYWVFIPTTDKWIDVRNKKLGNQRILLPDNIKDKDTYLVEIGVKRAIDIVVAPLTDYDLPVRVELDGYEIKETPAEFLNVKEGPHILNFRVDNDTIVRNIDVSVFKNRFSGAEDDSFDFRSRKKIKVISQDKNAAIYVDDKKVSTTSPIEIDLTYGTHTISAILPNGKKDTQMIDVKGTTLPNVYLDPTGTIDFEVIGVYGSHRVDAPVRVYGLQEEFRPKDMNTEKYSHSFSLPIGNTYTFSMSHMGSSGSKRITVTPNMDPTQEIVIRGRQELRWPWDIEMENKWWGLTFGYVMKRLVTKGEGICINTNGVWNYSWDKWLKGIQLGLNFQPQTQFGLGMYSGLFLDTYFSKDDEGYKGYEKDLDEYMEMDLYLPLHLWYQVPITEKVALAVHGGASMSFSFYGEFNSSFLNSFGEAVANGLKNAFSEEHEEYTTSEESWTGFFGERGFPKRFNCSAEIGLNLRLGSVMLGFQWSKGLNNHKSFSEYGDFKTVQDRRTFTISYNFNSDD